MIKYVAFLRGINVGGHKLIKMADLKEIFSSFGFKNVKTYIQSGNVLFETDNKDSKQLTKEIEDGLLKALGYEVKIIIRSHNELEEIVKSEPFKDVKNEKAKMYVTFLADKPRIKTELPFLSPKNDFEVLKVINNDIFSLSLLLPNGSYGNPVSMIEKEYGLYSTTRNWTTVNKILKLA